MSEITSLPAGWAEVRLADVARVTSGFGFPLAFQGKNDGDFPFAKVGDISAVIRAGKNVISTAANFVDRDDLATLRASTVPPNSIAFAKIGEAIRLNRRVITARDMVFDNNVMAVIPDPQIVDPQLLYQFFRTIHLYELASATTVPSIRKPDVENIRLALPPLREQQRIGSALAELEGRVSGLRAELAVIPPLLEQFRNSVLAAAFRGDLTADWRAENPGAEPASALVSRMQERRKQEWKAGARGSKDYEKPTAGDAAAMPQLPDGWVWATLEEITSSVAPICYGVVQPGEEAPGGVPLVRVCDLAEIPDPASFRTIAPEIDQEYSRSRLTGGEVLVSVVGTIGRVVVAPESFRGFNIARAVARLVPGEGVDARWIAGALSTPSLQDWLVREAREVARKTLNLGTLASAHIPLASGPEMQEILRRVDLLLANAARVQAYVADCQAALVAQEQSILAKAFRGELVPQDPEDEPASVLLERIRAEREREGAGKPARRGRKAKSGA